MDRNAIIDQPRVRYPKQRKIVNYNAVLTEEEERRKYGDPAKIAAQQSGNLDQEIASYERDFEHIRTGAAS